MIFSSLLISTYSQLNFDKKLISSLNKKEGKFTKKMGRTDSCFFFFHLQTGLCCFMSKIRMATEQFRAKKEEIEQEMSILSYLHNYK